MLRKLKTILLLLSLLIAAGCSSVEESYKPLYQAKPEKNAIEGRL